MSGEINLQAMSGAGLSCVTRLSDSTLESLITSHDRVAGEMAQMELGAPRLIEIEHLGQRYVLAGGAWRALRDLERRTARLAKPDDSSQIISQRENATTSKSLAPARPA